MKFIAKIFEFLLAIIFSFFGGSGGDTVAHSYRISDNVAACDVIVHYIDVGQGDSIFVQLPDGKSMLIDAGTNDSDDVVCDYIDNMGEDFLDYVVATHPHADHIGGMDGVIDTFDIGKFYMPDVQSNTKTFESMLDSLDDKNVKTEVARAGVVICDEGNLKIQIFSPTEAYYDETNDYSAVVKLTYGETDFLFAGDAQEYAESKITADVSADVLKVGHHGSKTSTSDSFLERVNPSLAVISSGKDNEYGHPHKEVTDRLRSRGIKIFRTDTSGTVVMGSDGENIEY
ncbi:MAG: MBL fold metallo-hydrolase [Clostridia bacterium]|nr:MBL fold metallo-hydrolase [Clostridia bacterium]